MPSNAYVYVAIVYGVDAVQFVCAAHSRCMLTVRLAEYVGGRARTHLHPEDAADLRHFLDAGQLELAVDKYFTVVGARWDEERLLVERVPVDEEQIVPVVS